MTRPTTKRRRRTSGSRDRDRDRDKWADSAPPAESGMTDRQRRILVWSGSIAAALATTLGLVLLANSITGGAPAPDEQGSDPFGKARPDLYQAWPSPKQFEPIADRKADAAPLTAKEVFGAKTLTSGRIALKKVGSQLDGNCGDTVWGGLAGALADAGCEQAVRGLYATADGSYVAQYTMFNLADVKAANALVDDLKALHHDGWVLPLESEKAGFQGYTEASGQAMGHFVGLAWIGRADGAEPGGKDDFVTLGLAVRESEKALYRRVVAVAGLPAAPAGGDETDDTAQPSEPPPSEPGSEGGASEAPPPAA
ncbi:hypothetical protein GCM10023194_76380 [Planotetraspora phitsanulokensis]|uniref:Uncharacterized protein n=1 Tax=Planotetraspora phitsanulokensis TaxID=575192 RepID=A0A8J3XBV0_9ACTN|nr:hypothetical protein [Planotetraspora phitsanulokensis]GII35452.1 hypothetical protein Pph01_04550 [Planotetraspora phitsanulokensis]